MDLLKSNMTVLAQIVKQIPAKIIDSLAKKIQNTDESLQSDQPCGLAAVRAFGSLFKSE